MLHARSYALFGNEHTLLGIVVEVNVVAIGITSALPHADLNGRTRNRCNNFIGLTREDPGVAVGPEALAAGDSVAGCAGCCS